MNIDKIDKKHTVYDLFGTETKKKYVENRFSNEGCIKVKTVIAAPVMNQGG